MAAAVLSDRYIPDRFLPDKAIDLVDEAAAVLRTEMDSSPLELDEAARRQMQLEIEMTGLKKEKDPASKERLAKIEKELSDVKEKAKALRLRWDNEKQEIASLQQLRKKIEQAKYELEKAQRGYDLTTAAQLQHGTIPQLEKQLADAEKSLKGKSGRTVFLRKRLTKRTSRRSSPDGRIFR